MGQEQRIASEAQLIFLIYLGLTRLDAVQGASEACDQAVFGIQRGSKRVKQRRNAPNA